MSIEERVKKVVSEQLDVSGDIDNNASFIDDLGADSLDTVELVMKKSLIVKFLTIKQKT